MQTLYPFYGLKLFCCNASWWCFLYISHTSTLSHRKGHPIPYAGVITHPSRSSFWHTRLFCCILKRLYIAKVSCLCHFPQASAYYLGTRHLHTVVLKLFWKTHYSWVKWTPKGIWDIPKRVWIKTTFSRSDLKPSVIRGPKIVYPCNIWFGQMWFIPMKIGLHRASSYLLLPITSQRF